MLTRKATKVERRSLFYKYMIELSDNIVPNRCIIINKKPNFIILDSDIRVPNPSLTECS